MSAPDFTINHVHSLEQLQRVWDFTAPVLGLPVGIHTLEYYAARLAETPELLVYADCAGAVAGCAMASIEGDHILVELVAVADWARRRGIGIAMMRAVEQAAQSLDRRTLILGAREDAEPFYLACGYQPNLFIQAPIENSIEALKALNPGYEVAWEAVSDGWSRLMLATPVIDRALQLAYEQTFPTCYTQTVFIKHLGQE